MLAQRSQSPAGKRGFPVFLPLYFAVLVLSLQQAWAQDQDQGLWLGESLALPISPTNTLRLQAGQRWDRSVSRFFQAYFQAGVGFQVLPWLNLRPAYRYVRHHPFSQDSRFENRLLLDMRLRGSLSRWQPHVRARIEGRFLEDDPGFARLRVRPGLRYTLATRGQSSPSLLADNEFFVDSGARRYNQNRFRVGITLAASAHVSLTPYYMIVTTRALPAAVHHSVWGLNLGWSL